MPFEIKKPMMPQKTFIINRNLHLNAEGKVVEEGDPTGRKNLGSKGKAFYEEEAKLYGLDESHRLVEEKPKSVEKAKEKPAEKVETPVPAETPDSEAKPKKAKPEPKAE